MNSSLDPFRALVGKLHELGWVEDAEEVARILDSAWTSSSEMLGELGKALLKFEREHHPLVPELKEMVDRCQREVRKVWPKMRS